MKNCIFFNPISTGVIELRLNLGGGVVGYQSAKFDIYKAIKQKKLHKNN